MAIIGKIKLFIYRLKHCEIYREFFFALDRTGRNLSPCPGKRHLNPPVYYDNTEVCMVIDNKECIDCPYKAKGIISVDELGGNHADDI